MKRRTFLQSIALLPGLLWGAKAGAAAPLAALTPPKDESEFRLAFGSCLLQYEPQPVWNGILSAQADAFVFLGDNIYADTEDMDKMRAIYAHQAAIPEFAHFRQQLPVYATWDDHDFGVNDGGEEYPRKQESKDNLLNFLGEPSDSPRRSREGVYESYWLGNEKLRVQLILLDLRWFRTPLFKDEAGHYRANPDPEAVLLGKKQWQWLRRQLREPADLRLLGTSSQFLAQEHDWEKWANFPRERERMMSLLDELKINNLLFLSGDMHYGEISRGQTPEGGNVWEITASGLNRFESAAGILNSSRQALFDTAEHFGMIRAKRLGDQLVVSLEIRDREGSVQLQQHLEIP